MTGNEHWTLWFNRPDTVTPHPCVAAKSIGHRPVMQSQGVSGEQG